MWILQDHICALKNTGVKRELTKKKKKKKENDLHENAYQIQGSLNEISLFENTRKNVNFKLLVPPHQPNNLCVFYTIK